MPTIPEPSRLEQVGSTSPDVAFFRKLVLDLSDERDLWRRYALNLARDAYNAGFADGQADERYRASRAWASQPAHKVADVIPFAELERRRHVLRGEQRTRETFGAPHPADYPGGAL